ncbi:hypothetical protein A0257_14310 [Hymenobacter psoromatis]|nr:hypothetical protein A0257_14310 [Hymenobacter psoromatis]
MGMVIVVLAALCFRYLLLFLVTLIVTVRNHQMVAEVVATVAVTVVGMEMVAVTEEVAGTEVEMVVGTEAVVQEVLLAQIQQGLLSLTQDGVVLPLQ